MLVKIIFYLVMVVPGHPPVQHHEEMASLADCQTAVTQMLDEAFESLSERKTSKRVVRIGCALIKEDRPT